VGESTTQQGQGLRTRLKCARFLLRPFMHSDSLEENRPLYGQNIRINFTHGKPVMQWGYFVQGLADDGTSLFARTCCFDYGGTIPPASDAARVQNERRRQSVLVTQLRGQRAIKLKISAPSISLTHTDRHY